MRTKRESSGLWGVTKAAFKDFGEDKCTLRAGALAYTVIFALPPLLILLIKLAATVFDPSTIQHALEGQFAGIVGAEGARTVHAMVVSGERTSHGVLATVLSIVGLLVGSTGAMIALQDALNAVWEVKLDPKRGGIKLFLKRRLFSLGMIMVLAFLLVVSLALTAAISALGDRFGGPVAQIITVIVSLAALAAVFAAVFKVIPDARIPWHGAWVGGAVTAVLFEIGRFAIGFYLGHSHPGNAFGAASDLAVILVWIYYAGALLLLGAEFTQHYAASRGHTPQPKAGAVFVDPQI